MSTFAPKILARSNTETFTAERMNTILLIIPERIEKITAQSKRLKTLPFNSIISLITFVYPPIGGEFFL